MATHSSVLAWRIPWTEKPGIRYFKEPLKSRMDKMRLDRDKNGETTAQTTKEEN